MKIYYNNETKEKINYIKTTIRKALTLVLQEEKAYKKIELSISFVNDEEIKEINKNFRDKDKATDVLSFPTIDFEEGKTFSDLSKEELTCYVNYDTNLVNIGDIIISMETIRKQASDFNNTFERELVLMTIHSMLHLLGYDHMVKSEEIIMFEKQNRILEEVGI